MAFFKSLIEKFKGNKDDAQKLYRERVKEAVGDGRLTTDKIKELEQLKQDLEVEGPSADATMYRAAAYQAAVDAVKAGGILTDAESAELERIQNYLGLRDAQVQQTKLELARLRQLTEIRQGKLPVISQNNVILRSIKLEAGEIPHWTETAVLLEETGATAGTSGFGLRLVRGATFQPGAAKG